jgi:homoserine dehydrogenase
MDKFKVAILGCGTVGGGTAKILLDLKDELKNRAGKEIEIVKILDLFPKTSSTKHNIPINLFCGNGEDITIDEASKYTKEILTSKDIDLVVETIGGTSEYILNTVIEALNNKKNVVTANKALLAKYGEKIFTAAEKNCKSIGFEAAVCGAIPIIKVVKECFTGDETEAIMGIMNGTSNYILTNMKERGLSFKEALKIAQDMGYAESDPTLDINGGDASHKLAILIKLSFGVNVDITTLSVSGIENITKEDLILAEEMNSTIKLICFAKKENNSLYAAVRPMLVKKNNILSNVNGSTNAVRVINKYSNEHVLIGKGAGSLETGTAIVGDIVFIAKNSTNSSILPLKENKNITLKNIDDIYMPYNIIFETYNKPGITGIVTTAIGNNNINIDTVSHNKNETEKAIFSVATQPCQLTAINRAIDEIKSKGVLLSEAKIMPILY